MSNDRKYEKWLRILFRGDFIQKQIPLFNDRLDSAYEEMMNSISKKESALSSLWTTGLGIWYWHYFKPYIKKVNYLEKTWVFILWVFVSDSIHKITTNYFIDLNLENKMLERYMPEVLKNRPGLKRLLPSSLERKR